ncbi:MAG: CHAT domain-containing protein [Chloroflexaceae bacterium]|nr:CHAT domain-containing protein [Chloroflexaceae bacterium]
MRAWVDLELSLHRRDAENYVVEMRLDDPQSDTDIRLSRKEPALVQFDLEKLRSAASDAAVYGKELSQCLFAAPALQTAFGQSRTAAQSQDRVLRLRLLIGPSAPELHSLRWETLRDPQDGNPLVISESLLFSRYLSSLDWQPVRRKARGALRALVVVANPTDVSDYQPGERALAPLDVAGELERARRGLGTIPVTALASGGSATLNNMMAHVRDGYDILYLVGHGAFVQGTPHLWLEDEQGASVVTPGSAFTATIRELRQRPTLVVLASCQSAGSGSSEASSADGGVLAALGPSLAEAGIPAVLAMQGSITMQTVADYMAVFFQELQRDGQIDRAVAVARGAVRKRSDWWMPVLFMRLKSGSIWYVPGFASDRPDFDRWPALLRHIRRKRCTPILGPGITEHLLGSHREIARRWAETFDFPLEPHARDDLPQVSQYLAVKQCERLFPHEELQDYLRKEVLRQYDDDLPEAMHQASLGTLLEAVGKLHRERSPVEPHQVLARLPFPTLITTNMDRLMEQALAAAGKKPQVIFCPWNTYIERNYEMRDADPDVDHPLVYPLFGRIEEPETMVLTEDDHFDFLIGVTNNRDLIPGVIRRALADTALLFLGFEIDDWNFRVLFRSIMNQESGRRLQDYTHIAVQIDPEDGLVLDAEGAREYLESYFQGASISIYWGSVEDFMRDLHERIEAGSVAPTA